MKYAACLFSLCLPLMAEIRAGKEVKCESNYP
jgi:hypothetical protein